MWRLWTKGWYLSGWWHWVKDATPREIAFLLPRNIALWAFIRVYCFGKDAPSPDYKQIHDAWTSQRRPASQRRP